MVTSRDLIGRGYFPKELPPPFNTEQLSSNLLNLPNNLNSVGQGSSKCCRYSIPKIGKARRMLGIPNPFHQLILCNCIEANWAEIERFINRSTISLTTPEARSVPGRALERRHDMGIIAEKRITEAPGSRFLLRTDISNYYPTIYTHSTPWALYGKNIAKACRRDRTLLGNVLDTTVRNTQDQQTGGIPIGPDTSLLLGEIIGTAIDQFLCSRINNCAGFRYIDDFYLYFNSISHAESALSVIHEVLNEFELAINPEKTKIVPLPQPVQPAWRLELSKFRIRKFGTGQKEDLINYFSKAFEYAIAYPDDSVLKYALGRFKKNKVLEQHWPVFESLILKCIVADPGVLPFATQLFLTYSIGGRYQLNITKIKQALFTVIDYHGKLGHGFELAWALWLCHSLNINLNYSIVKQLSYSQDCIVALIALDMRNSNLIPRLDVSSWHYVIREPGELYDEHWLLAYESKIKGWMKLRGVPNHVSNDSFFSILLNNSVSFYDRNKQVSLFNLFASGTDRNDEGLEYEPGFEPDEEFEPDVEETWGYF